MAGNFDHSRNGVRRGASRLLVLVVGASAGACEGVSDGLSPAEPALLQLWTGTEGCRALAATGLSNGDVVVLGELHGRLDSERAPLETTRPSPFLARVAPTGALRWVRSLDFEGAVLAPVELAPHPEGGVLLGGTISGPRLELDGFELAVGGGPDLLLAHFDDTGRAVAARRFGGAGIQYANGLSAGDHEVWLSGRFDRMELDGRALEANGSDDGFVIRADLDLAALDALVVGGPRFDAATAVEADRRGGAWFVLRSENDDGDRTAVGWVGAELSNPSLSPLPATRGDAELLDLALGPHGTLHGVGTAEGPLPDTTSRGDVDGLYVRDQLRTRIGGVAADRLRRLEVDERGLAWVSGSTESRLGSSPLGPRAAMLARLDADGTPLALHWLDGPEPSAPYGAGIGVGPRGVWWWGGLGGPGAIDTLELSVPSERDSAVLLRFEPW